MQAKALKGRKKTARGVSPWWDGFIQSPEGATDSFLLHHFGWLHDTGRSKSGIFDQQEVGEF